MQVLLGRNITSSAAFEYRLGVGSHDNEGFVKDLIHKSIETQDDNSIIIISKYLFLSLFN